MTGSSNIDEQPHFEDEITRLLRTPPLERVGMASSAMDQHRVAMHRLATVRGHAMIELRDRGMSAIDIAVKLGITRQQAHRLMAEAEGSSYTFQNVTRMAKPRKVESLGDAVDKAQHVRAGDEWEIVRLPFDGTGADTVVRRGIGPAASKADVEHHARSWTEWYIASQRRDDGTCVLCERQRGNDGDAASEHSREHISRGDAEELLDVARRYYRAFGTGHLEGALPPDQLAPLHWAEEERP